MRVVALAGGVGGAKLIDGLAKCLSPKQLTIIVNTGDDFDHFGLRICPDLDTICYTLAGLANFDTGWGRSHESWNSIEQISSLGGPDWFKIGDKDLGIHLERTRRIRDGQELSQITRDFCKSLGIPYIILPMTDQDVSTIINTLEFGELAFQEYFVKNQCRPVIKNIFFRGSNSASPSSGVIEAIKQCDAVIFCPSNPWVSINPILSIPGIINEIKLKPVVSISPLVGGKAVKGPAAKMFQELGFQPTVLAVAEFYKDIIHAIVIDQIDKNYSNEIKSLGIIPLITNIIMTSIEDRARLAQEVLDFTEKMLSG